jgi:NTP pyrophosphatase (non-canonical NTP hydrolase)
MDLDDYQLAAMSSDQMGPPPTKGDLSAPELQVSILGLAGEIGELLAEIKKSVRDRETQPKFIERIQEELGDILWYLASTADKFGLSLGDVAEYNLGKTNARFGNQNSMRQIRLMPEPLLDDVDPPADRLPRHFSVAFNADDEGKICAYVDGKQIGNALDDNSAEDDGYRFHDVFHLAYAAVLGWSPVTRSLLEIKRRSNPDKDRIQDGGRAAAIEEGVAALVFAYAVDNAYLRGEPWISTELLRTLKATTARLEVKTAGTGDWEKAILMGFAIWRELLALGAGTVHVNLEQRELTLQPLDAAS